MNAACRAELMKQRHAHIQKSATATNALKTLQELAQTIMIRYVLIPVILVQMLIAVRIQESIG
jgi:hypothetical protein